MSSRKTKLKETPNAPNPYKKAKQKHDYLEECINTILNREFLQLDVHKIFQILSDDLHFNLKNATPCMRYILAECFCYYMKSWPGWHQYATVCKDDKTKMEYTEKVKQYLKFKIKHVTENTHKYSANLSDSSKAMVSKEVQTIPPSKKNKPDAPYNLVISGEPNVLNNIVFIEVNNDIVIKQHSEKPWQPLSIGEFLNYSFVFVSVKLPDVELSRSNLHEFQRYITESGDSATCPEVDFITYIRKLDSSKPTVYTMDYIHAYFKQLLETLRKIPAVNAVKRAELEELFRQFVKDIQESNVFSCTGDSGTSMNTMATNTSVCFNIGGKTYIRNKKMVVNHDNQKEANAINFCEVLIPRMEYTLNRFTAEEDITTEDTSFKSLNEINEQISTNSPELSKFAEAINGCVTYQCLLCPKMYNGDRAYIDILDHYRFMHKGEQSMLCFICRKQFLVSKLAGMRWSHECCTKTGDVKKDVNVVPSAGKASNGGRSPPPLKALLSNNAPSTSQASQTCVKIRKGPTAVVKDILPSTKSTMPVNDLWENQNVTIMAPVISASNNASNNVTSSGSSTNPAMLNTLPVVNTLPTVNSVLPTTVLLTIGPSSLGSNIATSAVICNTSTTSSNNSITRQLIPLRITNSVAAGAPTNVTSVQTASNIDNTEPIWIDDDDDDDILHISTSASSTTNDGKNTNSNTLTPPVGNSVATSSMLCAALTAPSVGGNLVTTSADLTSALTASPAVYMTTLTDTSTNLAYMLTGPSVMDNAITTSKDLTSALTVPSAVDNVTNLTSTTTNLTFALTAPSVVNNAMTTSTDLTSALTVPSAVDNVANLTSTPTNLTFALTAPSVADNVITTSTDLTSVLTVPSAVDNVTTLTTTSTNLTFPLIEASVADNVITTSTDSASALSVPSTADNVTASTTTSTTLPFALTSPSLVDNELSTSTNLTSTLTAPSVVDNVTTLPVVEDVKSVDVSTDLTSSLTASSAVNNVSTLTTTLMDSTSTVTASSTVDNVTTTSTFIDLTSASVIDDVTTASTDLTSMVTASCTVDNVTTTSTFIDLTSSSAIDNVTTASTDLVSVVTASSAVDNETTLTTTSLRTTSMDLTPAPSIDLTPNLSEPSVEDSVTTPSTNLVPALSVPSATGNVVSVASTSLNISLEPTTQVNDIMLAMDSSSVNSVNENQ